MADTRASQYPNTHLPNYTVSLPVSATFNKGVRRWYGGTEAGALPYTEPCLISNSLCVSDGRHRLWQPLGPSLIKVHALALAWVPTVPSCHFIPPGSIPSLPLATIPPHSSPRGDGR